jgi:hypothetical protein
VRGPGSDDGVGAAGGLADLVGRTLTLKAKGGVIAHLKVPALVAGMAAGGTSIDDIDLPTWWFKSASDSRADALLCG